MSLTIGRVELDCPYEISHEGDRLSFLADVDGYLTGGDPEVAKVYRQQLLGYVNNDDERAIPITWGDDPDWDGYYRIESLQVIPTEMYLATGYVRYFTIAVSATRVVGNYATPVHDLYALGIDATSLTLNAGIGQLATDALYEVGWPSTHIAHRNFGTADRTTADGESIITSGFAAVSSGTDDTGYRFTVPASNHYDAACTVEQYTGGAWFPVVGRQVPNGASLRVTNGLVRVGIAADGEIEVENFDGAAWRQKDYTLTHDSGSSSLDDAPFAARVYCNCPDRVVVEYSMVSSDDTVVKLTVTLRRGSPMAEFNITTTSAETWKVTRSTTEAGTAMNDDNSDDYAVHATANDANGNRYLIVARVVSTIDTTNGGVTLAATSTPPADYVFAAGTTATFGIGLEVGGTSAVNPNEVEDLAARFQGAVSVERQVAT